MKQRKYLSVDRLDSKGNYKDSNHLKLSEAYLISKLCQQHPKDIFTVSLQETFEADYKSIFG